MRSLCLQSLCSYSKMGGKTGDLWMLADQLTCCTQWQTTERPNFKKVESEDKHLRLDKHSECQMCAVVHAFPPSPMHTWTQTHIHRARISLSFYFITLSLSNTTLVGSKMLTQVLSMAFRYVCMNRKWQDVSLSTLFGTKKYFIENRIPTTNEYLLVPHWPEVCHVLILTHHCKRCRSNAVCSF